LPAVVEAGRAELFETGDFGLEAIGIGPQPETPRTIRPRSDRNVRSTFAPCARLAPDAMRRDERGSTMELVHEMTLRCVLGGGVVTPGPGPLGMRVVASLSGGTVTGERISGTMQGAGADWLLIGPDGYGRVDVRGQIVTDDGAAIYVQYLGLLEMNKAVGRASVDPTAETTYDDQYFRITPRFETGDERYAWLNTSMFVAEGRIATDGVEYQVYRVT
jgi:hypothetical protein